MSERDLSKSEEFFRSSWCKEVWNNKSEVEIQIKERNNILVLSEKDLWETMQSYSDHSLREVLEKDYTDEIAQEAMLNFDGAVEPMMSFAHGAVFILNLLKEKVK